MTHQPPEVVMTSVMIRVTPADFDSWRSAHESCRRARQGLAVTPERLYRDRDQPDSALVDVETTDLARTLAWFTSEQFAVASRGISVHDRTIRVAEPERLRTGC